MWDVWIHILGIGAECACWGGAGGPVCRPYGGNVASPGGAPSRRALQKGCLEPAPQGEGFWVKHPSAVWLDRQSFTPLTRETAAYGRVRTPTPTAEFFGGNGGRTMCAPTGREGGNLPPHPPQCAHWGTCPYPLCPFGTSSLPLLAFGHFPLTGGIGPLTRGVGPQGEGLGKTKRDRFLTCPLKHRGETQFRTKFLCFLSFSKKGSPGSEEPGLLAYCFSSGPLVSQPRGFLIAAWARATET